MVTLTAYTGLLVLVALERLYELRLSNRHARALMSRGAVELGAGHYPVMVALHTGFLLACLVEPWASARTFQPWLGGAALTLVLGAQGLRYWAIRTLGERWNTRIIVLRGAAPVTGGPYRWLRHPNYVAVVVEGLALPLVHGAYWTAGLFTVANAALLWVRIRAEEQALGPTWEEAFSTHPRFIPGGKQP
jgi:methyltransferase